MIHSLPTPPPTSDEGRAPSPDVASPVVGSGSATLGVSSPPDIYMTCHRCRHSVRHVLVGSTMVAVLHDVDGLEPLGEGYWSGDNAEGVGHRACFLRQSFAEWKAQKESSEVSDVLTPTTPASGDSARGFGAGRDLSDHLLGVRR